MVYNRIKPSDFMIPLLRYVRIVQYIKPKVYYHESTP
jgi:hypothetical protein